jgi:hypothetical protein
MWHDWACKASSPTCWSHATQQADLWCLSGSKLELPLGPPKSPQEPIANKAATRYHKLVGSHIPYTLSKSARGTDGSAAILTKRSWWLHQLVMSTILTNSSEWIQWKTERRHMELGVITYRWLCCKQHYRKVQKGRRDRWNQSSLPLIGEEQKWPKASYKAAWAHHNILLHKCTWHPARSHGSRLHSQGCTCVTENMIFLTVIVIS